MTTEELITLVHAKGLTIRPEILAGESPASFTLQDLALLATMVEEHVLQRELKKAEAKFAEFLSQNPQIKPE